MNSPVLVVVASAAVALLSWSAVAVTRSMALRFHLVDTPNERSSHSRPIPLGGGISLVVINLAAWLAFALRHQGPTFRHVLFFVVGALLVAGISLLDDIKHVPFPVRLAVHGLAAVVFIAGYAPFGVVTLPGLGAISLGILGAVVTFLWIVGLTNAYNFMDGIDGMVGGQTVAAGLGWVMLAGITHRLVLAGLGACLAASALGFLAHNWQPARIFMGDVGATFLGYSFAAMTVIAAHSDPRLALAGVLLVWPSIFDTGFTVLRRLRHRQNIFTGHRTFLFHRLIHTGWSHAAATALYLPLPIFGALLAVTWAQGSRPLHVAVAVAIISACVALWALVRHQERLWIDEDPVAAALLEGAQLGLLEIENVPDHRPSRARVS